MLAGMKQLVKLLPLQCANQAVAVRKLRMPLGLVHTCNSSLAGACFESLFFFAGVDGIVDARRSCV